MQTYIVLYRPNWYPAAEPPLGFRCKADDADHAEEQLLNAAADTELDVLWIVQTDDMEQALADYYGNEDIIKAADRLMGGGA